MHKHLSLSLQDSFEYDGAWWLPENPDDQVPGRLTFDQHNGVHLTLMGRLGPIPPFSNEVFRCDIINGMTLNGIACTLVKNTAISHNANFPGGEKQTFMADVLFLGEIFTSPKDLQFKCCYFSLEYLEEWVTQSPFETNLIVEDERFVGHDISARSRTAFEYPLKSIGATILLKNIVNVVDNNSMILAIENDAFLKIEPIGQFDLDTYRTWVKDISRLIAVVIGENTWPRVFQLVPAKSDEDDKNADRPLVSAFFRTASGESRELHRFQMLLDFDSFVERMPHIADSWLTAGQRLQPVKDLFFMALYSEATYLEYKFISLVHALESYHRALFGNKYSDQGKKRKYYLKKRLQELLSGLDEDLRALISDSPDSFISNIVGTRNYFVHFEEGLKARAMNQDEMFYSYQRLGLSVRIILLREIGFDDKEIYNLLKDKKRLLPWDREE